MSPVAKRIRLTDLPPRAVRALPAELARVLGGGEGEPCDGRPCDCSGGLVCKDGKCVRYDFTPPSP
ncbi:MAG: hypothetical protein ACM3S5_11160 [Rhodospirillales bacterium]